MFSPWGVLSKEVGMSQRSFQRWIKEKTGISPRHLLLDHRIFKSKELLKKKFPIKDVAFEVGFCSQAHFSTSFKSYCGWTPAEFIKKNKLL